MGGLYQASKLLEAVKDVDEDQILIHHCQIETNSNCTCSYSDRVKSTTIDLYSRSDVLTIRQLFTKTIVIE